MSQPMILKVPRTMSTQHPDNVTIPFFANHSVLRGDDEIKEAYYAFSNLGVEEIMWDAEGKEADDFVLRKLMTDYQNYFRSRRIGRDVFITVRVPNPEHEKAEAKILLETLESLPRSYDTARMFYREDVNPPIFEVIVPMADEEIIKRIYYYYKNVVIGKERMRFVDDEKITVGKWIGDFYPKNINVIPLFEDVPSILNAARTMREYLKNKKIDSQRVFLARSDPAMNRSSVAVILALQIALEQLYDLQQETGVEIHPILGAGSAPFRGNLTPRTVDYILKKYPSVATFTIQSAFKYDFPVWEVQKAIAKINATPVRPPSRVEDKKRALRIMAKVSRAYESQIRVLAPIINDVARFVPARRMRKLHTGLFGYSRELKKGVRLPRVISFCAVMYSLGLPPDMIGLNVLNQDDLRFIKDHYSRFEDNLRDTLRLWNPEVLALLPASLRRAVGPVAERYGAKPLTEHKEISDELVAAIRKRKFDSGLTDLITRAGFVRGFLG